MAIIASSCPQCDLVGFDYWKANYGGLLNPGADFVRGEIGKLGHTGKLDLISGNSHETVSRYFSEHPNAYFDVITVDGDHSKQGAEQDLRDVITRLKVGGVLVFDDISHPAHPYLAAVWQRVVSANSSFVSWEYAELGYGIAFAVRKAR
ncbi:MAG: class I SAM-dependent methyltransferase [Verrucomicrobiota bacterium]|nr:class I SAM-dependent methyltransferase [Verrucomicrobiota bacterium]